MVRGMKRVRNSVVWGWVGGVVLAVAVAQCAMATEPTPEAVAGFEGYVGRVEAGLARQHKTAAGFVVGVDGDAGRDARLRRGEVVIEKLSPEDGGGLPGAMLHDWRGTAFVPGAKAAEFERLLRAFGDYPKRFAPQVLQARVLETEGDRMQAWMRVRQKHVITVTLDSTYDVEFGRLDVAHGYSISRSSRIDEVSGAGTRGEHALSASENHGFLWRLNTYWSWEERDGGLYVQIESVSLTRSIPTGLGWAVGPFVESVPRESLEFTLRAACAALRK